MTLLWLDVGYACGGVICNDKGIVVRTAPIFNWMKGKQASQVLSWKRIKKYHFVK